ncbi:predicted protein [Nematostella vectensis]|uniref:La-related protein 7 n=1 Tax=Nematostella vectensis TaxID=45351 RepID=A7ST95_NEMVE|nr:predicted protein [Nematostella vectensis]|eukprot:XP_001625158.1 predicted protein [Nematostella vectensis]
MKDEKDNDDHSDKGHQKHKKRTKLLVNQLKEQIDFYFSDSALLKDRFLKQQIENHPDGYVAISTIASFNKIKQMTDDIKLVKKAMKLSQQLELNEDGTMVRRMAPLPQPRNVDAETVYVEKLPFHADHDWLKKVFSEFGKVLYVSLPRFKHNGEIKGFAFIEFESKQQAEHVVQDGVLYREKEGVLYREKDGVLYREKDGVLYREKEGVLYREKEGVLYREDGVLYREKEGVLYREKDGVLYREKDGVLYREKEGVLYREKDGVLYREKDGVLYREKDGVLYREKEGVLYREDGVLYREDGVLYREKEGVLYREKEGVLYREKEGVLYREKEGVLYREKDGVFYREDGVLYREKDGVLYREKDGVLYREKDGVLYREKGGVLYREKDGPWELCSKLCGGGNMTRLVPCIQRVTQEIVRGVEYRYCEGQVRPPLTSTCNQIDCNPEWQVGTWSSMFNRKSKTKKEEKREPSIDDKTKIKKRRRSHSESDLESSKLSLSQSERKRRRTTSETSVDSNENASPFKPPPCKRSARNESGTADKSVGGTPEAEKTAEGSKTRKRKKSVRWEGSEEETGLNAESETRDSEGECSIKKKKSSESDTNDKKEEDTCESQKKHKTRKRKKKNKEKKVASRLPHLRVISKLEWQRLKEEYKSLQRQAMQDLKKQLKQTSEAQQQTETNSAPKAKPAKPSVPSPTQTAPNKIPPDLPLIQGVVLRFNRLDNELSTKDVRKTFSSYGPVAFVEMDEATGVGYVRFHTPEKCTSILEQLSSEASPSVKVTSLTGEEEKQYWKKINADRVARFQAKREKKRGTEKIARKTDEVQTRQQSKQIHIRFDEA